MGLKRENQAASCSARGNFRWYEAKLSKDLEFFDELHFLQLGTIFAISSEPPYFRGLMWSRVNFPQTASCLKQ